MSPRAAAKLAPESARVIADLEELAALTSDERGAQRVAWGPTWRKTREWFTAKLGGARHHAGARRRRQLVGDGAAARRSKSLVIGSHLDSVPGGGWLDGCLGVLAGLEVLRRKHREPPPLTIHLVDWADEEGARFGRSLTGSAASAGALDAHGRARAPRRSRGREAARRARRERASTLDRLATAAPYFDRRSMRSRISSSTSSKARC